MGSKIGYKAQKVGWGDGCGERCLDLEQRERRGEDFKNQDKTCFSSIVLRFEENACTTITTVVIETLMYIFVNGYWVGFIEENEIL